MKRKEVYKAIDTEREYQQRETDDIFRVDMIEEFNISTALLAMDVILEEAKFEWYHDNPKDKYQKTMDLLRKIAGMSVQMGEKYGMPDRKIEE
jgi:hypothetical protein